MPFQQSPQVNILTENIKIIEPRDKERDFLATQIMPYVQLTHKAGKYFISIQGYLRSINLGIIDSLPKLKYKRLDINTLDYRIRLMKI